MNLTIDRKVWLRGEGGAVSRLLRTEDGKQCCVGIYLKVLGVARKYLSDRGAAEYVVCNLPKSAQWLLRGDGGIYIQNDDPRTPAKVREKKIAAIFAKHDIKVKFVGRTK